MPMRRLAIPCGLLLLMAAVLFWPPGENPRPVAEQTPPHVPPTDHDMAVAGKNAFRFVPPDVPVLAERVTPLSHGAVFRERLVRLESERVPVRVEETWSGPPHEADSRLLQQEAMLGDRVLLRTPAVAEWERLAGKASARGWLLEQSHPGSRVARLRTPDPGLDSVAEAAALLTNLPFEPLQHAPDHLHFPMATPNDLFFSSQWAYPTVNASDAWAITTGSAEIVVAVIDTGADLSHPDLVGNLWQNPNENPGNSTDDDGNGFVNDMVGWDFVQWNNQPNDQHGHGTHVAGIIGAVGNNSIGIAGAAWTVRLIILRVGDQSFSTERIINAIDYATDLRENRGIPVVATNNSYGATSRNPFLEEAVNRSRQAGIAFVAAAGNNGANMDVSSRIHPAAFGVDNIIGTAATTQNDQLWTSSNFGSFVHLGAPGVGIRSTERGGGYGDRQGTSMATPMVTGTLALMAAANPDLDWQGLKHRLLASVDPLPALAGRTATGGRLNMGRAVAMAATRTDELVFTTPSVPALRLESTENRLILELAWAANPNSLPDGPLVWETVSGPAEVDFIPTGPLAAAARFPAEGDYRLRAFDNNTHPRTESPVLHVTVGNDAPVSEGLAAKWNPGNLSGGVVPDDSGENRAGMLSHTGAGLGLLGPALDFNGHLSRMDFNAPSTGDVTLAAWIRPEGPGNSIFPRVFNLPEFLLFAGREPDGPAPNQNTFRFLATRTLGDGIWHTPPGLVREEVWQHVAVTYRGGVGNDWPVFYHNGQPVPTLGQILPYGGRRALTGTGSVGNTPEGDRAWEGRMEGLRIFRRALAPEEVTALAAEPAMPRLPALQPATATDGEPRAGREMVFSAFAPNSEPEDRTVYDQFTWTLIDGPGTVVFSADGDPEQIRAAFSESGLYSVQVKGRSAEAAATAILEVKVGAPLPDLSLQTSTNAALLWPLDPVTVTVVADQPAHEDLSIFLQDLSSVPGGQFLQSPPPHEIILAAGKNRTSFTLIPARPAPDHEGKFILRLSLSPNNQYDLTDAANVEITFSPPRFSNWLSRFHDYLPTEDVSNLAKLDFNGNGLPALLEYALGLHPLPGFLPFSLPVAGTVEREGATHLTLAVTRPVGAVDVVYHFEAAGDVTGGNWLEGDEHVRVETVTDNGNGTETVTAVDLTPLGAASSRFIRLRVSLP